MGDIIVVGSSEGITYHELSLRTISLHNNNYISHIFKRYNLTFSGTFRGLEH